MNRSVKLLKEDDGNEQITFDSTQMTSIVNKNDIYKTFYLSFLEKLNKDQCLIGTFFDQTFRNKKRFGLPNAMKKQTSLKTTD